MRAAGLHSGNCPALRLVKPIDAKTLKESNYMGHLYDATPKWLKAHGVKPEQGKALLTALGVMADLEGPIKDALLCTGNSERNHTNVCTAIRHLIDMDYPDCEKGKLVRG